MSDQASISMMVCAGLETDERQKVERLDGPISEAFRRAGHVVRICQGRIDGNRRLLDFAGPKGTVVSVAAAQFLTASDDDAVNLIARSC